MCTSGQLHAGEGTGVALYDHLLPFFVLHIDLLEKVLVKDEAVLGPAESDLGGLRDI